MKFRTCVKPWASSSVDPDSGEQNGRTQSGRSRLFHDNFQHFGGTAIT